MSSSESIRLNVESAVADRYSAAAKERDASLCCPVSYDAKLLKVIPQEIIERDYGCGDPSRDVHPGEIVLDLGSGAGKMCFIVSQIVGPQGKAIGVDMNDEMLALARKHRAAIGQAIGWNNVEFCKGRIQDLALDLEVLDEHLKRHPIQSTAEFLQTERHIARLRRTAPMIADSSVDVVISNCVLNLVDPAAKGQLFEEIFRVLKPGGRAVISDIVSDRTVPAPLRENPELWSGCISGALTETEFLEAFGRAGFSRLETLERQDEPWRVLEGTEFRSITLQAVKGDVSIAAARPRRFSTLPPLPRRPAILPKTAESDSCCGGEKCC